MNSIWWSEMKEICALHINKVCGYRVTLWLVYGGMQMLFFDFHASKYFAKI